MAFDLAGAIDLHVHAAPDVTERAGDDLSIALQCAAVGMAGMAVKAHVESTASRAHHVNQQIPGFRYVGGVCLNHPVGGINPAAVESMFALGGRIVWMPSGHSQFHAELMGQLGYWGSSGMVLPAPAGAVGISILDEQGLTARVKEVVALAKQYDGLVGTSHLSPQESLALAAYCRDEGVRVIVTHLGWTAAYDEAFGVAAAELGASIEFTASSLSGYHVRFPIEDAMRVIGRIGVGRAVLASDTGGILSPLPHEALRVLAENLIRKEMPEADVRRMLVDNPTALVG
jgi:hypothetical protein